MNAVCVLKCSRDREHGSVTFKKEGKEVIISIKVQNIAPGAHGIHIHRSGNIQNAPTSLCDHYNPTKKSHGGLKGESHAGDLGNIVVPSSRIVNMTISTNKFTVKEILGRSVVIHENEDDLGKGSHPESKITGNSGGRILWGLIGISESC